MTGPRVQASPDRPGRPRPWIALLSYGLSLAFHAAILALLITLALPRLKPPPGPRGEQAVTVRWVSRRPRTPPPPTPERTTPTRRLPEPAADVRPPPGEAAARSDAPRASVSAPEGAPAAQASRVVGAAFSPPPLPLRGAGTGRLAATTAGFGERGAGKSLALARYGGDARTEDAVSRGLRWLAAHRDPDGGWRAAGYTRQCQDFVPCIGAGGLDYDVGVTAMAVLSFLGAGHLPEPDDRPAGVTGTSGASSPYGGVVRAALDYLLRQQGSSGCFGMTGGNYMYNHAIASFAMAEAYGLTDDHRYARSAALAVQFSAYAQQRGGGWDYISESTGRDDLSITGWQVMALAAARKAGLDVPSRTIARLREFLDRAIRPDGIAIYANLGTEAGRRGINMVAVGLLSRVLLDEPPERRSMRLAADRLLLPEHAPDSDKLERWERHFQSYYYWYTASLALFLHSAGRDPERWEAWNHFARKALLRLQSRRAHEDGSWPPEPNWIGVSGGRVYATAINVLTLETYYRYTPLLASPRTASKP